MGEMMGGNEKRPVRAVVQSVLAERGTTKNGRHAISESLTPPSRLTHKSLAFISLNIALPRFIAQEMMGAVRG